MVPQPATKVHSLTMYSDVVAFSDTGDSSIKVYNLSEQTCSVVVGNGEGTKMLSIECCLPKIQRDVSMLATQIVCALTSFNYHDDVVEQEESDLILLLDERQHTKEVVTIAEAAEMTEAAASEVQIEPRTISQYGIPGHERDDFKTSFSTTSKIVKR